MSRRANLPGAAELFRVTGVPSGGSAAEPARADVGDVPETAEEPPAPVPLRRPGAPVPRSGAAGNGVTDDGATGGRAAGDRAPGDRAAGDRATGDVAPQDVPGAKRRQPSGRERHDEKITVYISPEELHDLEHARLVLRREYGVRADRGRLVRVALALVLSDLESRGDDSDLVRRLREL